MRFGRLPGSRAGQPQIAVWAALFTNIARPGPYIWVDGIRSVPATISWRGTMRAKAITSASARSGDDRPRFLAPSLLRAQQGDQAYPFSWPFKGCVTCGVT